MLYARCQVRCMKNKLRRSFKFAFTRCQECILKARVFDARPTRFCICEFCRPRYDDSSLCHAKLHSEQNEKLN